MHLSLREIRALFDAGSESGLLLSKRHSRKFAEQREAEQFTAVADMIGWIYVNGVKRTSLFVESRNEHFRSIVIHLGTDFPLRSILRSIL